MEIFVDTAIISEIEELVTWGVVGGVTTNPSLILKSKRKVEDVLKDIARIVDDCISGEVISQTSEEMVNEALELSKISPKIVIKVPMTPDGLLAVRKLTNLGIRTNVTLVFSAAQALLAAKAGATYVSPFLGRLDDIGENSIALVKDIKEIFNNYHFKTEIICASIRSVKHVIDCAKIGADIATIPYSIIMAMFNHHLTDQGIKRFLDDYAKSSR